MSQRNNMTTTPTFHTLRDGLADSAAAAARGPERAWRRDWLLLSGTPARAGQARINFRCNRFVRRAPNAARISPRRLGVPAVAAEREKWKQIGPTDKGGPR